MPEDLRRNPDAQGGDAVVADEAEDVDAVPVGQVVHQAAKGKRSTI